MDRPRIGTTLRVSQDVIDLLNELIRFEDREDHATALAAVIEDFGGTAESCQALAKDGEMAARYEEALTRDLPPIALDAIRRNLQDERS
jgi:hypothetical protein